MVGTHHMYKKLCWQFHFFEDIFTLRSNSVGAWIAVVERHLCVRDAWIARPGNMHNLFEMLRKAALLAV